MQNTVYNVFGLKIKCGLPTAPANGMVKCGGENFDAEILMGDVPERLENPIAEGIVISCDSENVLLKFKGVGRFLITKGHTITIQPEDGAKEGDIATFAFGSAMGTLLHQRGILAVHGSAVETAHGAVIFTGDRGAGKSTIASALCKRGYRFVADDICAVHIINGRPVLHPGLTRAKLTDQSYVAIMGSSPQDEPVSPIMKKYGAVFEPNTESVPLHAIIGLEQSDNLLLEQLHGSARLTLLMANIYRPSLQKLIIPAPDRFQMSALVCEHTLGYRMIRPSGFERFDDVLDKLIKEFGQTAL